MPPNSRQRVNMNTDELVVRQQRLLLRSAQLRLALATQAQVLKGPLAVADQAHRGLKWLQNNPLWPLGALAVLLVLRPRRIVLWGGRAWWAWSSFKRVRNWLTSPSVSHFFDHNGTHGHHTTP